MNFVIAEILLTGSFLVVMYILFTHSSRKLERLRESYRRLIENNDYDPQQEELFREYITFHKPTLDDLEKLKHTVTKYSMETGKFRPNLLDRIATYSKQLKERNLVDTAFNESSRSSVAVTDNETHFIVCAKCKHLTPRKGKFCSRCGASLTKAAMA